jgi:hypothetical protein
MQSRMARSVPVVLLLSSLTALVGCNDASKCDQSRDANCPTARGSSGGHAISSGGSTGSPKAAGESGSGTAARGGFGATAHGVGGGE